MAVNIETTGAAPVEPIETVRVAQPVSTTQTVTPAPGEMAAINARASAIEGQGAAREAQGMATTAQTMQQAAGLDAQADQQRAAQNELAALANRHAAELKEAQGLADAAVEKYANHKFHGYFRENGGTADLVTAKIASALGGFGSALAGGPNEALESINRAIDRDFDRQKMELSSQEKIAEWKREGVKDILARQQHEVTELNFKLAAAKDAAANTAQAMLIRAGVPVEQAKTNEAVQGFHAEAAKVRQEGLAQFHRQVSTRGLEESTETVSGKGQGAKTTPAENAKLASNAALVQEHGGWLADNMGNLTQDEVRQVNDVLNLQRVSEEHPGAAAALQKLGLDPQSGAGKRVKEYVDHLHAYTSAASHLNSNREPNEGTLQRLREPVTPSISNTPEDLARRAAELRGNLAIQARSLPKPARGEAPSEATPARTQLNPADLSDVQIAQAQRWLKDNPKDPRAAARRARLKSILEARRGQAPTQPPPFAGGGV